MTTGGRQLTHTSSPCRSAILWCLANCRGDQITFQFEHKEGHYTKYRLCIAIACAIVCATCVRNSQAQEVPAGANAAPIPITSHDRVYHADQVSNTVSVYDHQIVATVPQPSPFCPNIAATPDGKQVWLTLKDIGATEVFNARPPSNVIATLNTGPITNHVNIVRNTHGQFAYVTVGGENNVKVYTTTDTPQLVATIPTGELPHGLWPSGDGTRIYICLENGTGLQAIDTLSNQVVATLPGGQACQALVYVPQAVPTGNGLSNLVSLDAFGQAVHLYMGPPGTSPASAPTTVTLNYQGPLDLLEAAVTGLQPNTSYTLGYVPDLANPGDNFQALSMFMTNAAGAQIVESIGPLRQVVAGTPQPGDQRFLLIVPTGQTQPAEVQLQQQ
jgi:hypothetical protein